MSKSTTIMFALSVGIQSYCVGTGFAPWYILVTCLLGFFAIIAEEKEVRSEYIR